MQTCVTDCSNYSTALDCVSELFFWARGKGEREIEGERKGG